MDMPQHPNLTPDSYCSLGIVPSGALKYKQYVQFLPWPYQDIYFYRMFVKLTVGLPSNTASPTKSVKYKE